MVPIAKQELRAAQTQGEALSPAVIEFLVLTAARENEVCGMQWREIDWQERVWTLPLERDKVGHKRKPENPHRVPLCNRAIMLLTMRRWPNGQGMEPDPDSYVWPSRDGASHISGKATYKFLVQTMGVSATIHGLRSTFRDWAGDMTHYVRNDIEECLGHIVGNAVERAYRRSDALEKRREIMTAWSAYCPGQ
jgi:integrase